MIKRILIILCLLTVITLMSCNAAKVLRVDQGLEVKNLSSHTVDVFIDGNIQVPAIPPGLSHVWEQEIGTYALRCRISGTDTNTNSGSYTVEYMAVTTFHLYDNHFP